MTNNGSCPTIGQTFIYTAWHGPHQSPNWQRPLKIIHSVKYSPQMHCLSGMVYTACNKETLMVMSICLFVAILYYLGKHNTQIQVMNKTHIGSHYGNHSSIAVCNSNSYLTLLPRQILATTSSSVMTAF